MSIDKIFKLGDEVIIKGRTVSVDEDHPVGLPNDAKGVILKMDGGYAVVTIPAFKTCATYDTFDLRKVSQDYPTKSKH